MTTHVLKSWPAYFQPILDGHKTFDIRRFDRPFVVGDYVEFREYDPRTETETGRSTTRSIIFIQASDPSRALLDGFVILGLEKPS